MMALTEDTDMMNVACLRESGPLGNGELFFWNSRKLTVAQPFEAPADAINRFAVKSVKQMLLLWKYNYVLVESYRKQPNKSDAALTLRKSS